MRSEMSVELQLDSRLVPAPHIEAEGLEAGLAAVAEITSDARLRQDVCVRICGAQESQALNAAYRDENKPTNVLSFAADIDLPGEDAPLGDLAICWPVVEYEARAQDKEVHDHFTHLYVHGLLHLLDFDHQSETEARAMEAVEVQVLAQLGVANPYEPCK